MLIFGAQPGHEFRPHWLHAPRLQAAPRGGTTGGAKARWPHVCRSRGGANARPQVGPQVTRAATGLPAARFPADKRETHADFGPSALGCQSYKLSEARNAHELARWRRWSAYSGRRADFLMRALPVQADAPVSAVVKALQEWLARGAQSTATRKPSAWHLARKAVVLLYPEQHQGVVVWERGHAHHPQLTVPSL